MKYNLSCSEFEIVQLIFNKFLLLKTKYKILESNNDYINNIVQEIINEFNIFIDSIDEYDLENVNIKDIQFEYKCNDCNYYNFYITSDLYKFFVIVDYDKEIMSIKKELNSDKFEIVINFYR